MPSYGMLANALKNNGTRKFYPLYYIIIGVI